MPKENKGKSQKTVEGFVEGCPGNSESPAPTEDRKAKEISKSLIKADQARLSAEEEKLIKKRSLSTMN